MAQISLNQISAHVFWLPPDEATDRPILGAVMGTSGGVMVDAGNSPAHAESFLDQLSQASKVPLHYLVLTHWHWDHVFGTSAINLPSFAHRETKQAVAHMAQQDWRDEALDQRVADGTELAFCRDMIKAELPDRSDLQLVPPIITFNDRVEISLGNVTCQIVHVGGDHAHDSSVVYIPEDKIVFLGDCLYPDIYQGGVYTTQQLFPLIERLLAFEANFYLAAHNPTAMSRAALIEWTDLLKVIGHTITRHGHDREAVLTTLKAIIPEPLDEEHFEIVDAFLKGLGQA